MPVSLDIRYNRLNLISIFVLQYDFLTGHGSRKLGSIDQSVNAAIKPDEDPEVSDRRDPAGNDVTNTVSSGELSPWTWLALLES